MELLHIFQFLINLPCYYVRQSTSSSVRWLVCLLVCNAFVQRSTRCTLLAYLALLSLSLPRTNLGVIQKVSGHFKVSWNVGFDCFVAHSFNRAELLANGFQGCYRRLLVGFRQHDIANFLMLEEKGIPYRCTLEWSGIKV